MSPATTLATRRASSKVSHNLVGQKLGRKGQETRERILAAMLRLMEYPDGPPVTLTSVAREAAVRLPNLYLYFPDMGELLLAALIRVMESAGPGYFDMLSVRWPDTTLRASCRAFLQAHYDFWNRHARILHMRNALADANDLRVLTYRNDASRPLLNMLAFQMDAKPGERDGEATLMATVLLTGIERMATVLTNPHLRQAGLMQTGTSHDVHVSGLLEAETELLAHAITTLRRRTLAKV
jgi:AcrR family transcriptional regulator